MSVIIYTCFTESNRSYAGRPPRVGTRFEFILARYHPRLSPLSLSPAVLPSSVLTRPDRAVRFARFNSPLSLFDSRDPIDVLSKY